jgi:hypothetical protein
MGNVDTTDVFRIGWDDTSAARHFKGGIDQVRVFNYARTAAQVAWDYNNGGPIGYWRFDECQGTTANDGSINGNSGSITIGASGSQTTTGTCSSPTDGTGAWYNGHIGKYNSSISFDGTDDYVNLGDPSNGSLDFGTGSFTLSAWLRTTYSGTAFNRIIEKYNSGTTAGYAFYTGGGDVGKIRVYIGDGTNYRANTVNRTINDGNWHHVLIVFDRSSQVMKAYIDGQLQKWNESGTTSSLSIATVGSVSNSDNLVFGSQSGSSGFWSGLMDDVRIFNYGLTATQVKQVYNQGSAVRFGPLQGQ